MNKYIDADKLIAEIERRMEINKIGAHNAFRNGKVEALRETLEYANSLQQEQPEVQNGKFVFPKYLYARTKDNKTIDMSYAPQDMTAVEYIRNDFVEQEQPEFPTTDEEVEKALSTIPEAELPDKYKTPDWLFEKQEQLEGNLEYWLEHFGMPKENIDNCITQIAQGYGACRYLEGIQHGAEAVNELAKQEQPEVTYIFKPNMTIDEMKDSINGKQQEQPEVDLEKEIDRLWESFSEEMSGPHNLFDVYRRLARHFWNKGYNARKEE